MATTATNLRPPTHRQYADIPAVNFSTLREAAKSALHYQYRLSNPPEETAAMRFGRAVHTAVLEPDRFPLEYVVYQNGRRAGKDWDEFSAMHAQQTILKLDEYETALRIRDAVRANKAARRYLRHGRPEVTLTWTDAETGLACKARCDWLTTKLGLDLKTTGDIEARTFGRLAHHFLYHCQLAFYGMGARANGMRLAWKIIAVEAQAPHDVAVFDLGADVLCAGEDKVRELLRLVAACRTSKKWPGRYAEEQPLDLPSWAFPENDDEIVMMGLAPAGGTR